MSSTFNGQILVEKLTRLNNSQQSIETLSHWCIFHMNKAKQVVETWDKRYHCSPQEQRLSFLYLANDILQNSRRKGSEFVAEFWKVLPDALREVIESGDEFGRNAALRLIDIWEDRKVFGSRGKTLKEEIMGKNLEDTKRNGKSSSFKLKQSAGDKLEKIVSSYEVVYKGPMDEDTMLRKCRTAIISIDNVEKKVGSDHISGQLIGSEFEELQGQHGKLRECIEKLVAAESSRETLVSHLREALQEQEFELGQLRTQLQAAQSRYELANNICQKLLNCKSEPVLAEQRLKEARTFSGMPSSFVPETQSTCGDKDQSAPVMYTQRVNSFPNNSSYVEEDPHKSAAAAVAAKLSASTSSAEMLSYVLSSLASEGVIGNNQLNKSSGEFPSEKRSKLENSYIPSPQYPQPPLPPFPHPESVQHKVTTTSHQSMPPSLPPPSSPPLAHLGPNMQQPPPTSAQLMQTVGSMTSVAYSYGSAPQQSPTLAGYPMAGAPITGMHPNPSPSNSTPYQKFQGSEGGFYSQPPLPISWQ